MWKILTILESRVVGMLAGDAVQKEAAMEEQRKEKRSQLVYPTGSRTKNSQYHNIEWKYVLHPNPNLHPHGHGYGYGYG